MKAPIHTQDGKSSGEVQLNETIFGGKVSDAMMFEAVQMQTMSRRQGSAHTKSRSEVRGGGKKPWKQKGTGRARHGSSRSPIWRGGGITHGPRAERDYSQ